MRAQDISVGDTLRLKPERREAYGKTTPFVKVHAIVTRNGYKTPFIQQADEFYAPSDFAKRVQP